MLLAGRNELERLNLQPAGRMTINEKAAQACRWLGIPRLEMERLVPDWLPGHLHVPDDAEPLAHFLRCIEAFQTRPPAVWLRVDGAARDSVMDALKQRGLAANPDRVAGAIEDDAISGSQFP